MHYISLQKSIDAGLKFIFLNSFTKDKECRIDTLENKYRINVRCLCFYILIQDAFSGNKSCCQIVATSVSDREKTSVKKGQIG